MGQRIDAFNQFRSRMNESILGKGTLQTKRFFNLDGAVYEDGARREVLAHVDQD